MALNGSFKVTGYQDKYMTFSWSATQSITDNTSTITWQLTGGDPDGGYVKAGGFKVIIDGETVYSVSTDYRIKMYTGTLIASGTKTIQHNADGTRDFSAYAEAGIYTYAVNSTGSATFTLNQIPRAATILTAPNFNDEENPTITYSNAAGTAVDSLRACIADSNGYYLYAEYREIDKNGSSYTFNLTAAERAALRNAATASNTLPVKFYVTTTISGNTYFSVLDKTLTIINAAPTLSVTVADINDTTLAFTGSADRIIKGYSKAQYSINAAALKSATVTALKATCGGAQLTEASGIFENAQSGTFIFSVTDSRGNVTTQTIEKTFIDYFKPTCNIAADPPTTDGETELTISGNWFNGSFGAVANGLSLLYRIKANSEAWGDWLTATPTITGNTYKSVVYITGLDYRNAYTLQARVADSLEIIESAERKVKTVPVFDWSENDFNFNVPVTIQGGTVDAIIEQGTSGIWTYRKWASGIAECWGWYQGTVSLSNNMAGVYYTPSIAIDYPFEFVTNCLTVTGGSMSTVNWARSFADTTRQAVFTVIANEAQNNVAVIVQLHAKGTWK